MKKKENEQTPKAKKKVSWGWIAFGASILIGGAVVIKQRKNLQISRDTINKKLGIIENQQTLIKGQQKSINNLNYQLAKLAEDNYKLKENYGNK